LSNKLLQAFWSPEQWDQVLSIWGHAW